MSNEQRHSPPIDEKKGILVTGRPLTSSSSSSSLSQRSPRTARFAEATSVISPIDPPSKGRNPFAGTPILTNHLKPEPQVADVGFGYMSSNDMRETTVEVPMTPKTPMKSALKTPGTGRFIDPRSPTFHEEVALEKEELKTDKQNARDVQVKKRVRVVKFFLRGVNFSCSLIVLSMLSTTFTIFNTTKDLPTRGALPAWAPSQQMWPQILILVISCISLLLCIVIFYSYWRGGHRKAQKTAIYYTMFALGMFTFSTVMWIVAAVILHQSRSNGNGQDLWGWSCNQNKRATLFQDTVNYALVCRLQNWSLVCAVIEIVVEVISISLYSVVAYRIWSKRKLHKSMNVRDKARSDLYLAQLRSQSAPNTPGFPRSAALTGTFGAFPEDAAERAQGFYDPKREADDEAEWAARRESFSQPQPPAIVAHGIAPVEEDEQEHEHEHMEAAPGEQQYDAVPIPGAYAPGAPQEARSEDQHPHY